MKQRSPRVPVSLWNGRPRVDANQRFASRASRSWMILLLFLITLSQWIACAGNPEPYKPRRPTMGESGRAVIAAARKEGFPERDLATFEATSPPQAVYLIDRIFRSVASTRGREDEPVLQILEAEIDSIRAELDGLGLGAGAMMRQRLGEPRPEEKESFRKAAILYTRWALARMRTGSVDERVKGTELMDEAARFAPESSVLAVIRASYLDFAGFRSNAVRELDEFQEKHEASDLVDLVRVRKRERAWKLLGHPEPLVEASAILDQMALRSDGWESAPPWILLERARLAYYRDSTETMIESANAVLDRVGGRASDRSPEQLLSAEAYLLLGIAAMAELKYSEADSCFDRALEHALQRPEDAELASILQVPWDLWTEDERFAFDSSMRRVDEVERFWSANDPILATPRMQENQVEYCRRVAETYFRFSDLDPTRTGPFTEPGRAVLRFGWPREWNRVGSRGLANFGRSALDFGVVPTWEFEYRVLQDGREFPRTITFQDPSGLASYVATDSLRGTHWPPHWFNFDFDGRSYPTNTAVSRFREFDGTTRLVLAFDTVLPDYSVRYPLQGFSFSGTVEIDLALLQRHENVLVPAWIGDLPLDQEVVVRRVREFRRRSGYVVRPSVERGVYQVASMLTMRDGEGRVVAVGVDNGTTETLPGFREDELDASDIMLAGSVAGMVRDDEEREVRPGWTVFGPDPTKFDLVPRASRSFLQGDELAFYLEVYNIRSEDNIALVDLQTTLETLRPDGEVQYAVTLSGAASSLTHSAVDQWNVVRAIGLENIKPGIYNLVIEVLDRKARKKLYRETYFEVVAPERLVEHYGWKDLEPPRTAGVVKERKATEG